MAMLNNQMVIHPENSYFLRPAMGKQNHRIKFSHIIQLWGHDTWGQNTSHSDIS